MATRYAIVVDESEVVVRASSNLHAITMRATEFDGWFEPPAAGELRLAVAGLESDNALYDREGARRLDAAQYPYISGRLSALDADGTARGELAFHGTVRPVRGTLRVETVDPETVILTGEQTFDVRDWGVKPPRLLMLKVHPEALVRVRLVARRVTTARA